MSVLETGKIVPLTVKVSDGSVAPEPLVQKRTAATREEILTGLTMKERMLVIAIVNSLEDIAEYGKDALPDGGKALATYLLQAFQDATGVDYVNCNWDG